jgi:hypothetical protein
MPRSETDYEQARSIIDHWADAILLDDTGEAELFDLESVTQALDTINLLSWRGSTHTELHHAVQHARHHGAGWRLIALVLGTTPYQARHEFDGT